MAMCPMVTAKKKGSSTNIIKIGKQVQVTPGTAWVEGQIGNTSMLSLDAREVLSSLGRSIWRGQILAWRIWATVGRSMSITIEMQESTMKKGDKVAVILVGVAIMSLERNAGDWSMM